MELIKSRAPLRISFIGGGTDVSPFPEKYGGMVVNTTITKHITATLKFRKDRKLRIKIIGEGEIVYSDIRDIKLDGKFDIVKSVIKHLYKEKWGLDIYVYKDITSTRAGLGGSAAMFVCCIGLFNEIADKKLDKYEIAELAYHIERVELKNIGGRQDQYASAFGGVNFIEFKGKDFVRVTPLNLSKETISNLEENLVLLNIGERTNSGKIIEEQIKNVKSKSDTLKAMLETKKLVVDVKEALLSGNLKKFGELLDVAWELKKRFSSHVSNPWIDHLYDELKKAGAVGGKISGAGGGGHMFVFCRSFTRDKVEAAAVKQGVKIEPFKLDHLGLVTWKTNF